MIYYIDDIRYDKAPTEDAYTCYALANSSHVYMVDNQGNVVCDGSTKEYMALIDAELRATIERFKYSISNVVDLDDYRR